MRTQTSAWLLALSVLLSCIGCGTQPTSPFPHDIPQADANVYRSILDMSDWRNPYIVVFPEGLKLRGDDTMFPVSSLLDQLSTLPASRWPLGRVVAIQATSFRSEEETQATWEQLIQVLKTKEIEINRIPSA